MAMTFFGRIIHPTVNSVVVMAGNRNVNQEKKKKKKITRRAIGGQLDGKGSPSLFRR